LKRVAYITLCLLTLCFGCEKKTVEPVVCYITSISPFNGSKEARINYDSSNRIVGLTIDGSGTAPFIYDTLGNLISPSSWYTYSYNSNNQIIKIVRDDGNASQMVTTVTFAYNASGQRISETTEVTRNDGPTTSAGFEYVYPNTSTNNFSQIILPDRSTITFTYDDKPNPLKRLGVIGTFFNPIYGYLTIYFSDNNIIKLKSVGVQGESTTTFEFTYNEQGYPATVSRGGSIDRTYTYNCK